VVDNISAGGVCGAQPTRAGGGHAGGDDLVRHGRKKLLKLSGRVVGRVEEEGPQFAPRVPGLRVHSPDAGEPKRPAAAMLRDRGVAGGSRRQLTERPARRVPPTRRSPSVRMPAEMQQITGQPAEGGRDAGRVEWRRFEDGDRRRPGAQAGRQGAKVQFQPREARKEPARSRPIQRCTRPPARPGVQGPRGRGVERGSEVDGEDPRAHDGSWAEAPEHVDG